MTVPSRRANLSRHTSGTTVPSVPGSSSVSGISNPRGPIRTRSTPGWRMRRFSAPPTAGGAGTSSRGCAATAPGRAGSPARAACVCTRSCSTPRTQSVSTRRSVPRSRMRTTYTSQNIFAPSAGNIPLGLPQITLISQIHAERLLFCVYQRPFLCHQREKYRMGFPQNAQIR